MSELKYIAIDEISVRKGHKYLTLVMDLKSGAVVFVGDGKGTDALLPFWKRLKRSKAEIKAVATDLSAAYIGAVLENLPRVPLVFDHFHVVKLINDRLTEVRRKLHREMKDAMDKDVLKSTNNKIKTMKRQAYGYRDLEFFKLRIMGVHEAKYALTG